MSAGIWVAYAAAAVLLLLGLRNRFVPLFLFLVWLYYGTIERDIFQSSFVIISAIFLLAYAIDRRPRTLSRRVIQVAISSCYIFSALNKFHPEFLSGLTLHELLGKGFLMRPELLPAINWLTLPTWFTTNLSYLVIAIEAFIGVGLWFKPIRVAAAVSGVILHSFFALLFPSGELSFIIASIGYLAFFENRFVAASRTPVYPKPIFDLLICAGACLICLIMPARFFVLSNYEYEHMSLYDRIPWGFAMFLYHENLAFMKVEIETSDGRIEDIPLQGRMLSGASTSEIISLAYYIAKTHPEAKAILIGVRTQVNSHGQKIKNCLYFPEKDKFAFRHVVIDGMRKRVR